MNSEKIALIVEGGGMRGIYTAGILEAFMENDFNPFSLYIGVSAGTCNISSYIAKQLNRNYKTYIGHMSQKEFINPWRFVKGGHLFDIDWLWEENQKTNAIDVQKAYDTLNYLDKEFLVVLTDAETGKPVYKKPTISNWMDCLKASCAIPFFYRDFCDVDGKNYVDGGLSDPLPIQRAIEKGATLIVVLRTRHKSYEKKYGIKNTFGKFFFRKYPEIAKMVGKHPSIYANSISLIRNPPNGVKVIEVAADIPLSVSASSQEREKLDETYSRGKDDGNKAIPLIKSALNIVAFEKVFTNEKRL